jgi:uncharacterized membrane protein
MRFHPLGLILIGVVLLIVGYVVPQPYPLPVIEVVLGWIGVVVGVILWILGYIGPRRTRL